MKSRNIFRTRRINGSAFDIAFDVTNITLLGIFALLCIYPFIYVLSSSLSDSLMVDAGRVWLYPVDFTFDSYVKVLQDKTILLGYYNSSLYSLSATALDVLSTFCVAYALSNKKLIFRRFFFIFFIVASFIPKGLIPTYTLLDQFGLVDNRLVLIIPGLLKIMYIVLVKNYIESLPSSLEESAQIDGASHLRILYTIIIPISIPVLATIALFRFVDEWNAFMAPLIYLKDPNKFPLTVILWKMLMQSHIQDDVTAFNPGAVKDDVVSITSLKHTVAIVTILPVLVIYPFLQRYFVKGIMLGAVKE